MRVKPSQIIKNATVSYKKYDWIQRNNEFNKNMMIISSRRKMQQ